MPRSKQPALPVELDGEDDEMFPLLTARQVAERFSCSPDYVHNLAYSGQLPYVLLPSEVGVERDKSASAGRRRRFRSDHVRQAVEAWTCG